MSYVTYTRWEHTPSCHTRPTFPETPDLVHHDFYSRHTLQTRCQVGWFLQTPKSSLTHSYLSFIPLQSSCHRCLWLRIRQQQNCSFSVTLKPAFIFYFMSAFLQKYCLIQSQLKVISSSTVPTLPLMFPLILTTFPLVLGLSGLLWDKIGTYERQVHLNTFCTRKENRICPFVLVIHNFKCPLLFRETKMNYFIRKCTRKNLT